MLNDLLRKHQRSFSPLPRTFRRTWRTLAARGLETSVSQQSPDGRDQTYSILPDRRDGLNSAGRFFRSRGPLRRRNLLPPHAFPPPSFLRLLLPHLTDGRAAATG